jgi:hypothetical protein
MTRTSHRENFGKFEEKRQASCLKKIKNNIIFEWDRKGNIPPQG